MQALRVKAGPPQGETMRSAPRGHIPTELVTPHQILHSCPARAPRESAVDEENGYLKVTSAGLWSLLGDRLTVSTKLCYCVAAWGSHTVALNFLFTYVEPGLRPAKAIPTNRWPLYQNAFTPRGQFS